MLINGSPHYATATAFRRALEDRLKTQAAVRDQPLEQLRREFLFQRFLALIFAEPGSNWVLKGGASLSMRLPDARYSKDLDLLNLALDPEQAVAELRALTTPRPGDQLRFVISDTVTYSAVNPVSEITVTAYIGSQYGSFSIDLATELHLTGAPDRIQPTPVIDLTGLRPLPQIVVYPLPDQIADKVCAMYEHHGEAGHPSTCYRDLVDLAIIINTGTLDAAPILKALQAESLRRGIQVPSHIASPGTTWAAGYASTAKTTKLDPQLKTLDNALTRVAQCLDPLLNGTRTSGTWSPATGWTGS